MKYMIDDAIVDTDKSTQSWEEERDWNGHNMIGRSSGSQWHEQTLYRSRKGRFYLEQRSRVQGEKDFARFVDPREAVSWLLINDCELPEDLKDFEAEVVE